MTALLITTEDVLSTGGDHPDLAAKATPEQRANAAVLSARSSTLLAELGYTKRPAITDGLRSPNAAYGAPKSAHKEAKAIDLSDRGAVLKAKIATPAEVKAGFSPLLKKHGLRMEHPADTRKVRPDGTVAEWCHVDTREPHGLIFHP